jgi:L-seryl-tRNA(Ser) seleniumtransferase
MECIMNENFPVPRYEDLGVRPLINCIGTITTLSGSLILPEVRQSMIEASKRYVQIDELMEGVGARIANIMQCEWSLVTAGCAAALSQVTAACVAGTDADKMRRLPDTSGMKNEVIVQASHRVGYDRAIVAVGTRLIEVTTHAELEAAYTDRTAMLFIFGDAAERGEITVKEMADSGHARGVPSFVDAAAERPDVPNWYLAQGVDAVAYSGGKCLRGPQASGLVLGRKQLLQAAFANGSPHGSIGRPMKVGKEEIMGLLAAVEQWVVRDHQAEWREWERRLQVIADAVTRFDSVSTPIRLPGRSNVTPHMSILWDADQVGVSPQEARRQLSIGEPRIEVSGGEDSISINPYMMEEGEETVVAHRLTEVLGSA